MRTKWVKHKSGVAAVAVWAALPWFLIWLIKWSQPWNQSEKTKTKLRWDLRLLKLNPVRLDQIRGTNAWRGNFLLFFIAILKAAHFACRFNCHIFFCWKMPMGTSINDVPHFLGIFDIPTLSYSITSDFWGCFGPTYSQVPNRRVYSFIPNEKAGLLFWANFIGLNIRVGWKIC